MSRPNKKTKLRCAVYTRKSTSEGLDEEITSLDVQRQAAEAYIRSQVHEGWLCLPERYDDGGYSGSDMDRPALQKLLADIEAGQVDCVVVYKVDRLSRSLLDFARLVEVFERHGVSFVSVTQQFNTSHSMGRLTLNILLSFAQFERELIAERTRDKIAAARRRGKWAGGMPLLGYDLVNSRLVVNPEEARRVRAIFELYLQTASLSRTVRELHQRGWPNKRWVTRKGRQRGGTPFRKSTLHHLLSNVTYLGKLRHKGTVYPGEHEGIVDQVIFEEVQMMLMRNRPRPSARRCRHRHQAMLEGLLRCSACASPMGHHYTAKGTRRYRYYVCLSARRDGREQCPSPSLPAYELEQWVVKSVAGEHHAASLTPRQGRQLVQRLLHGIEYDASSGQMTIRRQGAGSQTVKIHFRSGRAGHREIRCTAVPENGSLPAQLAPRVARLMALALRFEQLVRDGTVADYAELARLGHVTRARLSQIMSLTLLAPDIQEAILFLSATDAGTAPLTERHLRPIAAEPDWSRQRQLWRKLRASFSETAGNADYGAFMSCNV